MLRHLQRGACVKFNTFIRPKLVIPSNGLYKQSVFSQLHTTISNPVKVHSASVVNGLGITEKAVKQLQHIQEKEQDKEQMLRILVDSGGCHGYQNKLELTKTVEDDDM
ncbi:hypothetical protein G6F70_007111 [Rhizopus microsporus]|nr:hypothetical protein G6F71_007047 [Rhizopus microsporus]KAG1196851.1 hypothetical protein G6F70_007111 [Rhizopus microsporus]KAG1209884.1 hypothetical protein G6F69_005965 [Rhizopus microsporus]KAG1230063.1 hypothetical protein G6F67_006722 [Rhizopus microsporus]KAG1262161.1 hypothetical protein G6F68_006142 [Rhizopus microsporus]